MNPQPGEVWLADLGLAAKTRLVVVVSRFDPTPPRTLILYVPLTTQNRQSAYEVVLPRLSFLNQDSVANVQGLASCPDITNPPLVILLFHRISIRQTEQKLPVVLIRRVVHHQMRGLDLQITQTPLQDII